MKPIEELLRNLARPDVLEFGLVTNRLPSVNVGGRFEPVDDQAPSTETLLAALSAMGGGRFVEALSEKPVQWTTRLDGVGVIAIAAIMRKDIVQARFTVARRDPAARASVPPAPRPAPAFAKPAQPAPAPAPPSARDVSKSGEWDDDDDEPTVQTLSPGGPASAPPSPAPKPAQKPEVVHEPAAEAKPARPSPPTPTPPSPEERTEERPLPTTGRPAAGDATIATEGAPAPPAIEASASIDAFLAIAVAAHASDLYVVPGRPVTARIADELAPRTQPIALEHVERLVREVVPVRLRTVFDTAGACDFALEHPQHGRFRVNVSRQRTGPMLGLRTVARELPALPDEVAATVASSRGLVLVSGAPGQGKTTTLAALVASILARDALHVLTVEEPIEHVHARGRGIVTQREVGTHARSWKSAVDEALASDVDVLVLGDVRGDDALAALLVACEGGRLVLAATSAASPSSALEGLVQRHPPKERERARAILEGATRVVIGQRLVKAADGAKVEAAFDVLPNAKARKS